MEKIIIVCGPEGPNDILLSWIEVAFPECDIEVRSPEPDGTKPHSSLTVL